MGIPMKQSIAILPARGGSKRIPKKNIKEFCGMPIIYWSVKAAFESMCFDEIIVSTDCEEISKYSKSLGINVPFVRPKNFSDDHSTTREVINHAIDFLDSTNKDYNLICCIYPTAALAIPEDIRIAKEMLQQNQFNNVVFPATSFSYPIERSFRIDNNNQAKMMFPEYFNTRSQDLQSCYHDAGQFYWAEKDTWLKKENLFDGSTPLIIPNYRVQDIDNEEDWIRAEIMAKSLGQTNQSFKHFSHHK